jgi:hypothetical protein
MNVAAMSPRTSVPARAATVGGVGGALALAWGFAEPHDGLRGWLIAFVTIGGASFGALALLCVHRLVAGRWGEVAAPALRLAAGAIPLLVVAWLPIALGTSMIFPWAGNPDAAGAGVAQAYLNSSFFALRGLGALVVLSIFAWLLLGERRGRLTAVFGLIAFAVVVDFTAVDWILSLDPLFTSSAFGPQIAIQQVLSALAFALIATPRLSGDEHGDLASLTLAAALGSLYLSAMSLIVNWYGDQPDRAAWYLKRAADGALWLAGATFVLGAALPIGVLLFARMRRSVAALRTTGASILLAVALHNVWLIGPAPNASTILAILLALAAIGGISIAFSIGWRERFAASESRP